MMVTSALWLGGYLFAAIAMAAFAYVYWAKRNVDGMTYLLVATLAGSIQALSYLMLLVAPSILTKVILWKLFGVLSAVVVYLWYLFSLAWTDRARFATRPMLALAAAPLVAGSALLVTNASPAFGGGHSLYWSSVQLVDQTALVAPLSFSFGIVALAYSAYLVVLLAVSVGLLGEFAQRSDEQLYRGRNVMLVMAGIVALLFGIGFAFLEIAFEPHPLVYVLTNSFVVIGIVRFGTYDVMSLPENSLVEAIEGGVLVYAADGTVIEMNQAAERVLSVSDEIIGKGIVAVVELAERLPGVRAGSRDDDRPIDDPGAVADLLDGHEFTTNINGASRTFLVRVSDLTDDDGSRLGWTVLFYDVTDLRQKQHELDLLKQVLSRVLRHNVRNDLSVVKANAQMLEDQAAGLDAERLRTIQDKSDNLLDASEKARTVERLLEGEQSRSDVELIDVVETAIQSVEGEFPAVDFETSLPEECHVQAHWALSQAVENIIENAAMHNDSANPQVAAAVERTGNRVSLKVADNGPGIPYTELDVLERGEETALEHGSSVGLWLVDWIVDLSRGELDFENTDRGCTVTFELEHVDSVDESETDDETGMLDLGIGSAESTADD